MLMKHNNNSSSSSCGMSYRVQDVGRNAVGASVRKGSWQHLLRVVTVHSNYTRLSLQLHPSILYLPACLPAYLPTV